MGLSHRIKLPESEHIKLYSSKDSVHHIIAILDRLCMGIKLPESEHIKLYSSKDSVHHIIAILDRLCMGRVIF
jgi:hypothetical protein